MCGVDCNGADWKNNEPETQNPGDCMTVIVHHGGIPVPTCVGLTCAN